MTSTDEPVPPDSSPFPTMIDMNDPGHTRRRLVNKGFTPRQVRSSGGAVRAATDEVIDSVIEGFGVGTHFCLDNSPAPLELIFMFEHLHERMPVHVSPRSRRSG